MIARAVASRRPHSQPRPPTFRYPHGAIEKAFGALPSGLPHRDWPAHSVRARTIRLPMRRSTLWLVTVRTARLNASKPSGVRHARPPSAPVAGTLWVTPLYRLKTASDRVAQVLAALAEGLDVAAAVRVFGHRPATITTWLTRAGAHSATLHEHWFHHLPLPHVQLDEIRTRLRSHAHTLWLWLAVDPLTKIIPVLHLGTRTQAAAHATVHALHQTLAPGCIPVFTSDGLNLYFYALTAHCGQ